MKPAWIVPDWPVPGNVRAASTLRTGGVSTAPWHSLNLATHVGDEADRVAENRRRLAMCLSLPAEPAWLHQVHGGDVVRLDAPDAAAGRVADAAVTGAVNRVLAVLTADCLPILFCCREGRQIGVAHAGWRGVVAGVLARTVGAMAVPPRDLIAWIGPAIGAGAYEVGAEVKGPCAALGGRSAEGFFSPGRPGRWQFDLAGLARHLLQEMGLSHVYGGHCCTYADPARFFSHRRDGSTGPTGRMATLIWIAH